MSAFKDSGHHWWQECQSCGMAWFVETKPEYGLDAEATCRRCSTGADDLVAALSRARAEALEEARETFEDDGVFTGKTVRAILKELGASPVPATIPVERVREAMREGGFSEMQVSFVLRRLGVDLDAAGNGHG